MNEKEQSVLPEQIPREPPPNYEEAMAATGKNYEKDSAPIIYTS